MKRILRLSVELEPEHYDTGCDCTIILKYKKSEYAKLAYDVKCILYDAINQHPQFNNIDVEEI